MARSATSSSEDGGAPLYSPLKHGAFSTDTSDDKSKRSSSNGASTTDENAALQQQAGNGKITNRFGNGYGQATQPTQQTDNLALQPPRPRTAFAPHMRNPAQNYDGSPISLRVQQGGPQPATANVRPPSGNEVGGPALDLLSDDLTNALPAPAKRISTDPTRDLVRSAVHSPCVRHGA
jgi:hypothetical protein